MIHKDAPTLIYLAGPMKGQPNLNYDEFKRIATALRYYGYIVLNPAETAGSVQTLPRSTYMKIDFSYIAAADALFVLPEWTNSEGASTEIMFAKALGKPVYEVKLNDEGRVGLRTFAPFIRIHPQYLGGFVYAE